MLDMNLNKKSEKVAWMIVAILIIILFTATLHSCIKQKYQICYPEQDSLHCDTFSDYKIIHFLNFDTCYDYKLQDSSERIICGDFEVTPIK